MRNCVWPLWSCLGKDLMSGVEVRLQQKRFQMRWVLMRWLDIEDIGLVMQKLFKLSISSGDSPALAAAANHALLLIGTREPRHFLQALGRRVSNSAHGSSKTAAVPDVNPAETAQAITAIA